MKMYFTEETRDSEWAMNFRSVSSKVNVVVLNNASEWPMPNPFNEFDLEPVLGGQTRAT